MAAAAAAVRTASAAATVARSTAAVAAARSTAAATRGLARSASTAGAAAGAGQAFPGIGVVKYEGPGSRNPLAFKHYNAGESVAGAPMKEWLRFSMCMWHSFRGSGADPFGAATLARPWDDGSESMDNARRRVDAAFEFATKLGLEWYTFHDADVAPRRDTLAGSVGALREVAAHMAARQADTGVRCLWGTANLFSHPRYACGAATNPDAAVFAYAAAQVKAAMEVTASLDGANYVFWGGREGYQSLLNTNLRRELDHYARFLHMAVAHKKVCGWGHYQGLTSGEHDEHQYHHDTPTAHARACRPSAPRTSCSSSPSRASP